MNRIDDPTTTDVEPSDKAKHGGDDVLQELWSVKAQLNREANYDLDTLGNRANATALRLVFSISQANIKTI